MVPIGYLSAEWTVGGSTDAIACEIFGVDEFELVVLDDHDVFFTSVRVPCDMFGIRIGLPEGDYAARAVLTQSGGQPATETLYIDHIVVVEGIAATAELEFSASLLL